jgi:hypothetical protein
MGKYTTLICLAKNCKSYRQMLGCVNARGEIIVSKTCRKHSYVNISV